VPWWRQPEADRFACPAGKAECRPSDARGALAQAKIRRCRRVRRVQKAGCLPWGI
jgi:hypothetical protein